MVSGVGGPNKGSPKETSKGKRVIVSMQSCLPPFSRVHVWATKFAASPFDLLHRAKTASLRHSPMEWHAKCPEYPAIARGVLGGWRLGARNWSTRKTQGPLHGN